MLEPEREDDSASAEAGGVETKEASDSDEDEGKPSDARENEVFGDKTDEMAVSTTVDEFISHDNRCDLLWRGVLPKRSFPGFKFQECKSAVTARKLLEAKGVAHYWDMAYRADDMLEVAQI